mgnify:CR=1 FL=1
MFKINKKEKTLYLNRLSSIENIYKFPIRLILHKLSRRHIKKNSQLVVFSFDHIAHAINLDGLYEKNNLELLIYWINSNCPSFLNGNVLDIGANIGNHSLFFSNYFKKVISFEPHPKIFKILSLNTENIKNIKIYNFGASNKNTSLSMLENKLNMGGSKLSLNNTTTSLNVKLKKLDDFCKDLKNITLLKIDTEGHEKEVLEGAKKIIVKHRPLIIFEQQAADFKQGSSSTIDRLKILNYNSFGVLQEGPFYYRKLPKFIRFIIFNFFGIFFNQYVRIKIVSNIEADFYPFIIALPDE